MSLRSLPQYIVRTVCVALAVALSVGPGFGNTVSAFSADTATSVLSVTSDPAGATVYVDGRLAGHTPLKLEAVTVGDHRVRVVKAGYLENSRIVAVGAGKPNTVTVKLTKGENSPAAIAPGGGGKKWLLIGLGAVAIGAAVVLAGGSSNEAPTISSVTPSAQFGLMGATSISFNAAANDPDGDTLSYEWDFGNGQTSTAANPSHVFSTAGVFNVKVKVSDGKKSAESSTTVTIRSMTGTWRGSIFAGIMTLTQTGTTVTGSYVDVDGPGTLTAGAVSTTSPSFRITINQPQFGFIATFTGNPDASVNVISGTLTQAGFGSAPYTLTRQ